MSLPVGSILFLADFELSTHLTFILINGIEKLEALVCIPIWGTEAELLSILYLTVSGLWERPVVVMPAMLFWSINFI